MISASAMAQMLGATNRLGVFPAYGDKFQQAGRVMSSRRRLGRQPGIGDRRRPRRRTGRVRTAHPLRLNAIEHKARLSDVPGRLKTGPPLADLFAQLHFFQPIPTEI